MTGRLKLIEQQLLGIDSAAFQNLCDVYLALREQELSSINRTGSQFGKQKTVKGTPDTFFRLSDGSLRYVEYTTQANDLVKKIEEDIDKCLDPAKTGLPANQVHKIIICFNSRLDVAEETAITQYATSKNISIELIGLDWLALEIYSKYLILSKDILGIPLDTGQLLPLLNFIEEYNNKAGKLSTPLDNVFLHRKSELTKIEDTLNANDILIISGAPGVGKTKIALEGVNNFLIANKDYYAFAVSKKDQDISEDLKINLQQDKNYILLIDDGNRQLLNLKQIIGIFKEKRKGNIKLLITVRDYALNDITNEYLELSHEIINLNKFTDDEIIQLISSDSFEIKNPKYQKRIVEIADGNARLAIMASRLAQQEQVSFLYGDGERIFELYDYYFKTFIKDFDLFSNKSLLKTLGIISFFFTIDRNNKELLQSILATFEMDYYEFNEAIDELEKRELLEVQYNHARISEQVMATYFFYKVFIKEELLPFKALLFTFFSKWKKRFSDTIIPSNNSFGYENVLKKISNTLSEYLHSVLTDDEKALEFFSLFWFYKREETLSYFHQRIENLPEPVAPDYDSEYEMNDFVWDRDKTLDFLTDFFNYYTESFISALELAFEYCRKKPEKFPELIRRIREKLLFDEDDYRSGFPRQIGLFKLLIIKLKEGHPHYVKAFFALSRTFLSHHYQITKRGRNHSIVFYQYPLPFNDVTKEFRRSIWDTLFESFSKYPAHVFSVIKNFRPGHKEAIPEILEFDLTLLLPFIEDRLNPDRFENCAFVHDFVSFLDREILQDRSYQTLKAKYNTKEYEYFRRLDWSRVRGRNDYDFKNYDEFKKLKEEDIRTNFLFIDTKDFQALHKAIQNILSLGGNYSWGLNQSLDIIVEENFLKNNEIGFKLLESILMDYPNGLNPLYKGIRVILNESPEWALRLWNFLKSWKHEYKIYWQLAFFDCLPVALADNFYKEELIKTVKSIDRHCYLQFESFSKFTSIKSTRIQDKIIKSLKEIPLIERLLPFKEPNVFREILKTIYQKNELANFQIKVFHGFFEKYSKVLEDDFQLLSRTYIQQETFDHHFDLTGEGLKTLIHIRPKFLFEYINFFYGKKGDWLSRDTDRQLRFVWDLENCEDEVEKSINLIVENTMYIGISNHPVITFFRHLTNEQSPKAKQFILNYIEKYNSDVNKMNSIFDVVRHVITNFFEQAFLHYLEHNMNVEDFKKVYWTGNGGAYSGDVIIGEVRAKDWQGILEIVNKSPNQLELIQIKTYIKKQIEYELRSAEGERKRKFVDPEGW